MGGYVPQPNGVIVAAAGQRRAVRAERHREDPADGVDAAGLVARSHNRTMPSLPPTASVLPSGSNATKVAESNGPILPVWWRVARSHARNMPSSPLVASAVPSGLNATDCTTPVWPVRAPIWRWVATSHNRTPVFLGGQRRAVRAARHHGGDLEDMDGEGRPDLTAGGHVPQPHHVILAAAGQGLAVAAERHRVDRADVAAERAADLAVGGRGVAALGHDSHLPRSCPGCHCLRPRAGSAGALRTVWPG